MAWTIPFCTDLYAKPLHASFPTLQKQEIRDQFVIALEEIQRLRMEDLWPFLTPQDVCIRRTRRNLVFSLGVVGPLPLQHDKLNGGTANLSHGNMESIQVLTLAAEVRHALDRSNNWHIIPYQHLPPEGQSETNWQPYLFQFCFADSTNQLWRSRIFSTLMILISLQHL